MATEKGKAYLCEPCGMEVEATASAPGTVYCCGEAMKPVEKKELYYCDPCGAEVEVVKPGGGILECCGKEMKKK